MTEENPEFFNRYRKKHICLCGLVTEEEIIQAVKNGATTIELLSEKTRAARNCKSCVPKLQEYINKYS